MPLCKFIFGIEQNETATCATYLKSLINLFSRLLWLPVRVQWTGNSKQTTPSNSDGCNIYELRKPHQLFIIFHVIMYIGVVGNTVYSFYQWIVSYEIAYTGGPAFILSMLADVCQLATLTLTWKLFLLTPELFVNLLNTLGQYENTQTQNWKFKIPVAVTCLMLINFIVGLASPHQRADTSGIPKIILNATGGLWSCNDNIVNEYVCSFLYTFILSWSFWSHRAASMNEYFTITVAYTVYVVGKQFVIMIRASKSIDELMFKLRKLRVFNDQINSAIGTNYFLLFLSTLSYYAATPAYLRRASFLLIYQYWYKLVYLSMHSLTWICTSEFHRMIQVELRRWISEKKFAPGLTPLEVGKLNILAVETEHDPVGVSCRYFTVNYQLLSSLLGLLITYSIIAVQVQKS